MDERTNTEIRNELMSTAKELKKLLLDLNRNVHDVINRMEAHGDALLSAAADESGGVKRTKKIVYTVPGNLKYTEASKCELHPNYQARRRPRSGCVQCLELYAFYNPEKL